ncbi:hypothetical protein [Chamaesiphon sp. VAR_48_metabat_403]|uniref:hypothetical protein n=1 Tax=Chamaesiphon sp. VAR_48_metabat_403 TaxID=2964700 RepID=UPI00286E765F|nr:hypothetical protein [Chamaesiphon sp. VAR_48_metabat_403]
MTLIRLIQRASILAGMTFASLSFHSNSAHADTPDFCVIGSNRKTVCGQSRGIERMCVTTDGNNKICGKFKSMSPEQAQENSKIPRNYIYTKELEGAIFTIKNCRRSSSSMICTFFIRSKKENVSLLMYVDKGSSSIISPDGKTYPSSRLEYNGSNQSGLSLIMSPDIDYIVNVIFENVPSQISKASLININAGKIIQFRNIPISN